MHPTSARVPEFGCPIWRWRLDRKHSKLDKRRHIRVNGYEPPVFDQWRWLVNSALYLCDGRSDSQVRLTPVVPSAIGGILQFYWRHRSSSGVVLAVLFVSGVELPQKRVLPQYVSHSDRLGVGVQFAYSNCRLDGRPTYFPHLSPEYGWTCGALFRAGGCITTLVLLGQVLELRARSATSRSIRAIAGAGPRRKPSGSTADGCRGSIS